MPFDFGKSRWFLKSKDPYRKKGHSKNLNKAPIPGLNEEAEKIMKIVKILGMQLVQGKKESFEIIKDQLLKVNI